MVDGKPLLQVSHVSKRFGSNTVLEDVSLTVQAGQVLSVIGPSGSGKSTLLRCIAQLETADEGFVELDGEVLGYVSYRNQLRQAPRHIVRAQQAETGVVFQQFNLFPHLTVLQNITEAPIRVRGIRRTDSEDTAHMFLERVGLADKAKAYPEELSGGQRQRVAIARALAMNPKLLLFDEPTSALDPELVGEVLDVIRGLAHTGTTLMVVTHEIQFSRNVSDHVLFLADGRVVESGPPAELIDNPQHPRTREFLSRIINPNPASVVQREESHS
jgi:ABC-type polar amino acid transport system ATPase subunit